MKIGTAAIMCIISSIIGSSITLYAVKDNEFTDMPMDNSEIIREISTSKEENIYHLVSEKAMPAVVGITTVSINENNIFNIPTQSEGVGSGFIVDSNGYIVTNSHVVSDGSAVEVNVVFNDGTSTTGRVLWNDSQLDLAVVKVEKTGLPVSDLGDSDDVRTGDIAIAIGNPLGLEFQKTVTQGIISGLDRSIETENSQMTGLLQTDASINPGNSGGPLLNSNGEVIGINTAKVSGAEGLGFSIPINSVKQIVEQIIETGTFEKVTLGIQGLNVEIFEAATGTNLSAEDGVYIAEVVNNSPAQISGILSGDVITQIGNTLVSGMSDLNKALYEYKKGEQTTITVDRGGQKIDINVVF